MAINSKGQRAKSMEKSTKGKEQKEKSREQRATCIKLYFLCSMLYALCFMLIFLLGCASLSQKEAVLATVDGEPITEVDLQYSLNITHRRENLSSAGALKLSQYVHKLVDDRLLINEARSTGMNQYPEVKQALEAYILRESVVRLHDEEIEQKVTVTEKQIHDYYKKNYERFTIGLIGLKSEEEAKEVLEQLRKGGNFRDLAQKYSVESPHKDGSEVVLTRNTLSDEIAKTVSSLKPDERSDVMKIADKYFIVKLIDRKEAPDDELKNAKARIEKGIRKQKEKERSDEYLKYLHEKAIIKVDRELLSTIKLDAESGKAEKWSKDNRPLAEVNGSVLTVGDFITMATPSFGKSKEDLLDKVSDRKVIDQEALGRHYEMTPELKKMVSRYENQLLKNTFIKRVIIPQIVVSEKALVDYYSKHQKNFIKPTRFKIQQITVKSMEEAQEIMNSIQNGADFSWLAKRKSADSALKGGDAGWFTKAELPKHLQEIIDTLEIGEISQIIKMDSLYGIFRIQEKTGEEIEAFDKVKDTVYKAYINEQVNTLLDKYINQLKTEAQIKIYEKEIQSVEENFKQ